MTIDEKKEILGRMLNSPYFAMNYRGSVTWVSPITPMTGEKRRRITVNYERMIGLLKKDRYGLTDSENAWLCATRAYAQRVIDKWNADARHRWTHRSWALEVELSHRKDLAKHVEATCSAWLNLTNDFLFTISANRSPFLVNGEMPKEISFCYYGPEDV
jgi:hypothetical protein